MTTLVSPGVSVTIVDESFYIPASAPTVPLIFLATRAGKFQADGITPASGSNEHSVVRTVTSIAQSISLYGVPYFQVPAADLALPVGQRRQQHGDSRNEYGLLALNQFLEIGNRAYVVRANVDLTDADIIVYVASVPVLTGTGDGTMSALAVDALNTTVENWTVTAIDANNFSVSGSVSGPQTNAVVGTTYDNGLVTFLITAGVTPFSAGDTFTFSVSQQNNGPALGPDDATVRGNIVTALNAEINANTEVRSEIYEYNLILCPGYWETTTAMVSLAVTINEEAMVIADTPYMDDPATVATWALTTERTTSTNIAYYYPHGLTTNLDGAEIMCAASGIALKVIAYSDSVSEVWFAPGGARRGVVSGISQVGYVSGTLGTELVTFNQVNLNQGQRDTLYEDFKNINPIVFFPGRGLIVWGQKTSPSATSALDRINVSREMMYIKRALRKGSFPFVFEPNDQVTRDNLKASVDGFLGDILIKRGLYDFATLCDDTNNTATRIDLNELWCDVALKPVKAAEFIYIPVRVLSTGAAI